MLNPITPDPEPTDAELTAYMKDVPERLPDRARRSIAEFWWEIAKQDEEPNAFRVWRSPMYDDEGNYNEGWYKKIYLFSDLWLEQIRPRVLAAANDKCVACGAKATEVHHRDYRPRVMAGEDLSPLVALCENCHDYIHYDANREFRSWSDTERLLVERVERREAERRVRERSARHTTRTAPNKPRSQSAARVARR